MKIKVLNSVEEVREHINQQKNKNGTLLMVVECAEPRWVYYNKAEKEIKRLLGIVEKIKVGNKDGPSKRLMKKDINKIRSRRN